MKDTPPEIDARYRAMLMQRSGEERLTMGCAMRETARALVEASILEQDPQATPEVVRRASSFASMGTNSMPIAAKRFSLPLSLQAILSPSSCASPCPSSRIFLVHSVCLVLLIDFPTRSTSPTHPMPCFARFAPFPLFSLSTA